MIVYDDTEPLEKLKIYDARVVVQPHYDTFAEFTYSYHYGDAYIPYIKQDEPLKLECQHFLDCIQNGTTPITDGQLGLEVVRILEGSGQSLRQNGTSIDLGKGSQTLEAAGVNGNTNGARENSNGNGNGHASPLVPGTVRNVIPA